MAEQHRKIPTHEVTYARIRDMILFGELAPGQPVTIQGLIRDLDAGMTPVREAIRRLEAEGALMSQGNRRVAVPRLDLGLLDQIAFARMTIEPRIAELAAANLNPAVIAELEIIDGAINEAIVAGDIHAYLQNNHAFHFHLYEVSAAPVLVDIARSLWLRFGPSLRVVARTGTGGLPDRHEEALGAMRRGAAADLSRAIASDIAQGIDQVKAALARGEI